MMEQFAKRQEPGGMGKFRHKRVRRASQSSRSHGVSTCPASHSCLFERWMSAEICAEYLKDAAIDGQTIAPRFLIAGEVSPDLKRRSLRTTGEEMPDSGMFRLRPRRRTSRQLDGSR